MAIGRKFISHPSLGWRWCYYINIIAVGLAIVLLFFFYHPPKFEQLHERKTKRQLLKQLDCKSKPLNPMISLTDILRVDIGIFLWTAGLTLFLMGISWGGAIYPWKSAAVISSLVIGAVMLIGLFIYEGFMDLTYPAIPVQFFANRGFISLVVCATVASVSVSQEEEIPSAVSDFVSQMFYYSAVLLWPQQIRSLYTTDVEYGGWLSVSIVECHPETSTELTI